MANRQGIEIELAGPMDIAELRYPAAQVAVMAGTSGFKLSNAEKYFLRKFCLDGGTLVADAAGGGEAFGEAFAREVPPLLLTGSYRRLPLLHPIYTSAGPSTTKVRYRRALRETLHGETRPRLWGLTLGERVAVVFSPIDLTAGLVGYPCWELKGYEPESAFSLMRNIVLYAVPRRVGAGGQPDG
jgi:hypothetical protein